MCDEFRNSRPFEALPVSFLHVIGVATYQKRTQFGKCCGILGGTISICMCLNIALAILLLQHSVIVCFSRSFSVVATSVYIWKQQSKVPFGL